ncbi:ABC transporter ATP-binding protein [Agromyces rhizosphaerae]|uniref:ABC transporter ATP-binding protein n=1 Tax=Agromyces rhizosphaerae TaxID=88374 RepID=A0A9W6FSK6_9MICO|nr:ABC transporter ATP-binding protein [Agromyces rhizosphaerae]GLI28248.1 ABC transporter ATP-binding protein [Agromyces rhizosphaerae]
MRIIRLETEPGSPLVLRPLLEVDDIHLSFGGVRALDGPGLTVAPGEIVGLIGPNGAGKTSLFNCISGLYAPDSGSIRFAGEELVGMPRHRIARLGIGRTFQNLGLIPRLPVLHNVLAGTYRTTRGGFWATALALPQVARDEERATSDALKLLHSLDLLDVALEPVGTLPFGTQKRVELARALIGEPRLLLVDEPANGLVHSEVMELADTIRRLAGERNMAVLVVEHHMGLVRSICDRVVVLDFGKLLAEGRPREVANDPRVVEAYLGTAA